MQTQEPSQPVPSVSRVASSGLFLHQLSQLLRMLMPGPSPHILGCGLASGISKKSPFVMLMYSQDAEAGSSSSSSCPVDWPRPGAGHTGPGLPAASYLGPTAQAVPTADGHASDAPDSSHANVFCP